MINLKSLLQEHQILMSDLQIEQLELYVQRFQEKNAVMNLSSIRDRDEIYVKHVLDSLLLGKLAGAQKHQMILDLGTGGGFPGIPLKVMFPNSQLVFLDATAKKLQFVQQTAEELALDQITFVHSRAEDAGQDRQWRGAFNLVVARAVAYLPVLLELALPFLAQGGVLAAAKNVSSQERLDAKKALHLLGGEIAEVKYYQLPEVEEERSVVLVRKVKTTPAQYPRKPGIPSKKPL